MKSTRKLIIIVLVILIASSSLGYIFSTLIKNNYYYKAEDNTEMIQDELEDTIGYAENLQIALNKAISDKNFVKETSVEDLIKRNEAGDYSLSAALNILGNPVCVLESIDSYAITCYDNEEDITKILSNISINENYTNNSFIQMYWMKNTGEAIISWIALNEEDTSEIKIIGIITSQYQDLIDVTVPSTKNTDEIFNSIGITKEEMLDTYKPLLYKTQYKLLECQFTKTLMNNEEYKNVWSEYIMKNDYGYLHMNTKDNSFYLVYQDFTDTSVIPSYSEEERMKIVNEMTIEDFLKIVPDAKLYEKYIHDNNSTYVSYVIKKSEDESFIYYDFIDGKLNLEDLINAEQNKTEVK